MGCKRAAVIISAAFLIFASACHLPRAAAVSGANPDATLSLQTQIAQALASTATAQAALAEAVDSTLAARITDTPQFTFTPSDTPTPTFTLQLAVGAPMVSVSVDTNCRMGPGTPYENIGSLMAGESAEVVGRGPGADFWVIMNPDSLGTCWIWGQYATVTGDTSKLPVVYPPTLTPTKTSFVAPAGPADQGGDQGDNEPLQPKLILSDIAAERDPLTVTVVNLDPNRRYVIFIDLLDADKMAAYAEGGCGSPELPPEYMDAYGSYGVQWTTPPCTEGNIVGYW